MRHVSLGLALLAFWLALSGHYTPFLISVGAVCSLACVYAAHRLGVVDPEGHPIHLLGRGLSYFPWLFWEIVKSTLAVTKLILHPRPPISPTMTVVDASQRTAAGIATFGNSITLTPGTVTTDVKGSRLTVHALERAGALDVEAGDMNARVKRFEGCA